MLSTPELNTLFDTQTVLSTPPVGLAVPNSSPQSASIPDVTYYISQAGSDESDGLSPETAWQSFAPINQIDFDYGANLLFRGGDTFNGSLIFDEGDLRPPGERLRISSYGEGRANLQANQGFGIWGVNVDQLEIFDLNIIGNIGENQLSGIGLYTNDSSNNEHLQNLVIDSVNISGFRNGVSIGALSNSPGFRNIKITNSRVHDNIRDGIELFAATETNDAHQLIYIAKNEVYNNFGDPALTNENSGNGIVVGGANGAVLENNLAHHNGGLNRNADRGPVGIWAWNSTNVVIQYNESHSNRTGNRFDGAGFDLDGGVTNSVMQYNYSHNNDGAGFLVGQFPGAASMVNNAIRYNLSRNDGRKNSYGGITLFQAPGTRFEQIYIHNNLAEVNDFGSLNASAFKVMEWSNTIQDSWIYDNVFVAQNERLTLDLASGNQLWFSNNQLDQTNDPLSIRDGQQIFTSAESWQQSRRLLKIW